MGAWCRLIKLSFIVLMSVHLWSVLLQSSAVWSAIHKYIFTPFVSRDGSGEIDQFELQTALTQAGLTGSWKPFSAETCRLMIAMLDRDQNGTLSFEGLFVHLCIRTCIVRNIDLQLTYALVPLC